MDVRAMGWGWVKHLRCYLSLCMVKLEDFYDHEYNASELPTSLTWFHYRGSIHIVTLPISIYCIYFSVSTNLYSKNTWQLWLFYSSPFNYTSTIWLNILWSKNNEKCIIGFVIKSTLNTKYISKQKAFMYIYVKQWSQNVNAFLSVSEEAHILIYWQYVFERSQYQNKIQSELANINLIPPRSHVREAMPIRLSLEPLDWGTRSQAPRVLKVLLASDVLLANGPVLGHS
jgi:hypothetical protein